MSSYLEIACICLLFHCCNGYPIDPGAMLASSSVGLACLGIVFLVLSVLFLIGCACCRQNNQGFKQFSNSTTSLHQIGFSTGVRLTNEVPIFPPPGVITSSVSPPPPRDPSPRLQAARPAAFASSQSAVPTDQSQWFVDPNGHVPRQQIFYQREIGKGWFGKVVEGEARGAKVVVRILREDSTPEEKSYFLHEAQPYRDLRHRNLLSLHGKSVQQEPYLLLLDLCTNGDLKSFLLTNSSSKPVLNEQGICLKMMTDIAEGLNYMHENNFIHTDLAARNCLVSSDLTIKIGDYGTSIDKYKDEYYITENVAIPIRWCAPETLHCTPTTIEAKQVTVEANVWSLGVVLWEISEFGRLPYDELTDDQVIIRVFGSEKLRLPQPDCPYGVFLYNVLGLCWRVSDRAMLSQVLSMMYYLRSGPGGDKQVDFDARWSQTKPNTIPRVDNHPLANSREFDSGVDLEMKSCRSLTLSAASDDFLQSKKSASLTNLQGSLEDVRNVQSLEDSLAVEEDVRRPLVPSFRLGPLGGKSESSSDTEEETWRTRIERGEFTEKVKEKSKSVTDLMVLTHIDSEGSESDSLPSLQPKQKNGSKPAYTSIGFGSEGNIRDALLSEELQTALRQLTATWKPDQQPFLGKVASEINPDTPPCVNSRPLPPIPVDSSVSVNITVESPCDIPPAKTEHPSSCSSHIDPNIPEITVTEASMMEPFAETESNAEPRYSFDAKPRKLVIVCREEDCSSSDEDEMSDVSSVTEEPNGMLAENAFHSTPLKFQNPVTEIQESTVAKYECSEPVNISKPKIETESFQQSANIFNGLNDVIINDFQEASVKEMNNEHGISKPKMFDEEILVIDNCKLDEISNDDISVNSSSEFVDNIIKESLDTVNNLKKDMCRQHEVKLESEGCVDSKLEGKEYESAVILGSCEDYTLDYFKGLKTTYVPPDSISDGSSDRPDDQEETGEDSDFINDESQASQVEGLKTQENLRPKPVRQDSGEDPYPDSMSASVTTMSSSSGYATIEKDKIIRNEYNYIEESYSPAKDKMRVEEITFDEGFPVKHLTESFLTAEKEYCSLEFCNDIDFKVSNVSLEATPKFLVDEVVSQDPFVVESCNYTSYFSDSGEGSNSQHDEIKELKTRLEDAMKLNNDYHLKKTDEEYAGKIVTPDDERSSDSGFRDKGSLSESAEDTCDEKYNLEDIDTELDDFAPKHFDIGNDDEPKRGEGWFLHPQDHSGWLPESTEYEVRESVALNADFINAIRCELRDKLPQANISLEGDDDSSPETEECVEAETGIFNLPVQLSPIMEERESNQSSLILDDISPVNSNDTPETNNHLDLTYDVIDSSKKNSLLLEDFDENGYNEDDVLVVDTETNEATLIESPKAQNGLVFSSFQPLPNEEDHSEDTLENYAIQRESVCFTPDISLGSSSPDQGNLSGFFMSPCSVRSDLFDSGPPSLPFDITQSLEEADDLSPAALPDLVTSSMNNSSGDFPPSPDNLKLCSPLDDSSSKSFDSTIKNTDTSTEDNTLVSVNDDTIIRNTESKKISDFFNFETETYEKKLVTDPNCLSPESTESHTIEDELKTPENDLDLKDILDNIESADKRNGNEDEKKKEIEKEIDLLIMNNNNAKSEVKLEEVETKNENDKLKNGWLEEILAERSTGLEGNGWPSVEELVVKPCLSSTIALSSPGDSAENYPTMPLTPCSEPGDSNWRPTITQLMDLAATETDEMTTSFIEPGDGTVTPEWDSDTSESSSSGEFIWKEGDREECLGPLVIAPLSDSSEEGKRLDGDILEEDSDVSSEEGSCSSEFVPSTWDSSLTPSKSSIRSPSIVLPASEGVASTESEKKKRKVVFKKEKYQCIYEYPREPSDDDDDDQPTWQSSSNSNSIYDYFVDWELGESELSGPTEADSDSEDSKSSKKEQDYDFYRLNYNYNPSFQLDEGEFFSKCFGSGDKGSEFFPGELEDVDSGDEFTPLASDVGPSENNSQIVDPPLNDLSWPQERPEEKTEPLEKPQISDKKEEPVVEKSPSIDIELRPQLPLPLGVLRHTKDQLKLDLRPQPQPIQPVLADIRGEANILDTGVDTVSSA